MTTTTHTPGPWKFGELSESIIGPERQPIAQFDYSFGRLPDEEIKANARLIAEAPTLVDELEAAYAIISQLCELPHEAHNIARQGYVGASRERIRATLARIKGPVTE